MLVEYKKKANIYLIFGFVTLFIGNFMQSYQDDLIILIGFLAFIVGLVAFVYGCMQYALAKGQNKYWGLLGIINLIGLIILFFLPDKHKKHKK